VWPAKTNPTIRVFVGAEAATALHLPVVTASPTESAHAKPIDPHVQRTPWLVEATPRWSVTRDLVEEMLSVEFGTTASLRPPGCSLRLHHRAVATVARDRPAGARIDARAGMEIELPAGERIDVQTSGRFTSETILLEGSVTIDGQVLFAGRWSA
jgi:hypothetical protein